MASLDYLYAELSRIEREIQSTQNLIEEETDTERLYRYRVTLDGLYQAKADVEESIQREQDAADNARDY